MRNRTKVLSAGCWVLGLVLVGPLTPYPSPLTAQQSPGTSVTIYQDGRILVRRTFPIRVPAGGSTLQLPVVPVDPSSLVSLDSNIALLGTTTPPGPDAETALRASIGKVVIFRSGNALRDTVSGVLLGVDPVRVRLATGQVLFGIPGQPVFPEELTTGPVATELRLNARRATDRLRLGGFAQGGGWNVMYTVIVQGATAQVSALASIRTPLDAQDAEVQLLAGQVNQASIPSLGFQEARITTGAAAAEFGNARSGVIAIEEGVGGYHLYSLPGRQTLRRGTVTGVALFNPVSAPIVKSFEVGSPIPFRGYWGQSGEDEETPVATIYTLTRPRRTPFGDTPLPGGAARIFEADSAGRLQLIGEAATGHRAVGEELRINAGTAFDLVAKRIQTSWQQGQEPVPGGQRRTRTFVTSSYADTLRNQGDADATIDLLVERGGDWRIVESSIPAERVSSTKARFRVRVPARGEAVLTYRIRSTW